MATLAVGGTTVFDGSATQGLTTASTFPPGHIIKLETDINSTTGGGASVSGSVGSANTHGYELFDTSFTPLFATSKILIQTSSIFIGEESNIATYAWLNAWYDTTRVAMVYGTGHYTHFQGSLHWTVLALNHVFDSWGTSTKNINVRGGNDGAGYIKNRSSNGLESQAMTVTLTIMEVAQ